MNLKYSEILLRNAALAKELPSATYSIAVLSNIVVHQLKEVFEHSLRTEGIPAVVAMGDYDNIAQDSVRQRAANAVVIFWEPCNLVEGMHYKIELLDEKQMEGIYAKTVREIDFVLGNLADTSLVLFNTFTGVAFSRPGSGATTALERLSLRLTEYLRAHAPRNVKLVELDQVLARTGLAAAIDLRYFHSSKALYTVDFYRQYAEQAKCYVRAATGRAKKVLVFDCDNTLWKGVLGEDGFDGIEMSAATKDGALFAEAQAIALSLSRSGVLLGLCTKNNAADVEAVLASHPDMQLRSDCIAARRVNWADKASNLRELAAELNLGLDSFVFVDDSPFEANLIRQQLPAVTVLQVPERLHDYPRTLREHCGLFYSLSATAEDARRGQMYRDQAEREADRERFADLESYLASLAMKLTLYRDDRSIIARMAQLTQKTNQFNLTTRRYTEQDIERMVADQRSAVFAFGVSDRFGDSGITGLCIVHINGAQASIDTFLMSCRIIGRNIEFAFMNRLIAYLKARSVGRVAALYRETPKNGQVKDFFDRCSFALTDTTSEARHYRLNVDDYRPRAVDYVEVAECQ